MEGLDLQLRIDIFCIFTPPKPGDYKKKIRMPGNVSTKRGIALISILLLLFIRIDLSAQYQSQTDVIHSLISNHLPIDNQNWEISQNPVTGFMYFANSAGLVEYNGISSRLFAMPFQQGVRSVYADTLGKIYTGSFEDFGFWDKDGKGGLTYHSLTQGIHVEKNDEIWNILELNGTIYFQSFTTIYAYADNQIRIIKAPAIMLFLFSVGDAFIVQALGLGLFHFDGENFELIRGSQVFATLEVLAIIERSDGSYWVCTANDGIFNYDGSSFIPMNNEISRFLKHQTCNAGLAINDSLMVFGTILNGIAFCNEEGDIRNTYNFANGLNNNTVLSLYKDKEQGLWVGLDEGANYLHPDSPFRLFADLNGTLGTIYTVIRKDDMLYLGTNHGLFVANITYKNGDYDFYDLRLIANSQGQVWKLYEFGDQLLCGHNEGTFLVEGRSFRKISEVTGGWSFAGYNDLLLEGTYTGIVSFTRDNTEKWSFRNRLAGYTEPTRYIEVDYLGYVWAIHPQKGLYRLELNERADSVVNILHFNTIADTSGKINISMINNQVVFMTSENIYSFNYENREFFPLRSLEAGLGEYKKATQIIHHEKNNYWFMLENKIGLFDISKSLEARKVNELVQKYTDLPGREQQIVSLDRNTLLIPTRQAFTTFELSGLNDVASARAPVITRLVFNGKSKSTIIIPGVTKKSGVPSKENNLTVYLADPGGFGQSEKEYLYRIPSLDETWRRTIFDNFTFLNLKYGTYRLQVRSATSEDISETEFTINRPWYLSIVAFIYYVLALAGFILLGIKIFRIELNRHRQLIEYEVRKRKLESELDYKSYELMLTMRFLIRKTEILKELQKQITSLKTYASSYPVKYVAEMERIVNNGLDTQTDEWKNAMNNLKLSQEGFFRKLKEKFPNLTPNDLRLCSYLRMNFSTKEIAQLLNISGRAVEIGRYRLRSKMHLDHNLNLTEFLIHEAENSD